MIHHLLEYLHVLPVGLLVPRRRGLHLLIPPRHVLILPDIEPQDIERRNRSDQRKVGQGQLVPGGELLALQETVEELERLLDLLQLGGVVAGAAEDDRVVVVGEAGVEGADVEVEALVDEGALLRVLRVQGVALAVLVGQVGDDGAALPQREAVVDEGGDRVLGVDLEDGQSWSCQMRKDELLRKALVEGNLEEMQQGLHKSLKG